MEDYEKRYKELVVKAFEHNEILHLIIGSVGYFQRDPSNWNPAPNDYHEVYRYFPAIKEYIAENPSAGIVLEASLRKMAQIDSKHAFAAFIFIFESDWKNRGPQISPATKEAVIDGVEKFKKELAAEKFYKEDPSENAEKKLDFIRWICRNEKGTIYERILNF